MQKFNVTVHDDASGQEASATVCGITVGLGIASTFLNKKYKVTISPISGRVTHFNSRSAEMYIDSVLKLGEPPTVTLRAVG